MLTYEKALIAECPTIMREGALRGGFDCPVVWQDIVRELSLKLEAHAKQYNPSLIVDQIKSEFGGLRYYVSYDMDEIDRVAVDMIAKVWVIVRGPDDGSLRQECLQPDEQTAEIVTLFNISAAAASDM
jgi:hypothetical protein